MQNLKPRSNAKQRIIQAAFDNFVIYGYEGASLSNIATSVGIRKASLYTHFSSKEAMFMELLHDALNAECAFVDRCFQHQHAERISGADYCQNFKTRYDTAISFRFLIRMAYAPPAHLVDVISQHYDQYIQVLHQHIRHALQHDHMIHSEQLELYCDAYVGIIDSLSVELLYAGKQYQRRLNAMMMLYQNALKNLYQVQ